MTPDELKDTIRRTFADTPYPGDHALVRSRGQEPDAVVALFRGKNDWRALTADYVDRAGAASPSALSFLSPAAFRFYLPAYLLADIDGGLTFTALLALALHAAPRTADVAGLHGGITLPVR